MKFFVVLVIPLLLGACYWDYKHPPRQVWTSFYQPQWVPVHTVTSQGYPTIVYRWQ